MQARVTTKGLTEFILSGPSQQRAVLREFKYPQKGDAPAKIPYYNRARRSIQTYHRERYPSSWLLSQAQHIRSSATKTPQSKVMCEYNARALEGYHGFFSARSFQYEAPLNVEVSIFGVGVKVNPELHVFERNRRRMVRIEFAASTRGDRGQFLDVASQIMFEAISRKHPALGIKPGDVMCFDLKNGAIHKARVRTTVRKQIAAACQNIAALWPSI